MCIEDAEQRVTRWGHETFGTDEPGLLAKLLAEMVEFAENPCEEEAADVAIMLMRYCQSRGTTLTAAVERKFAILLTRQWEPCPDTGNFRHVKERG